MECDASHFPTWVKLVSRYMKKWEICGVIFNESVKMNKSPVIKLSKKFNMLIFLMWEYALYEQCVTKLLRNNKFQSTNPI